jgi:oxygen-independent coproporphyrinogen-3 oxidase
MVSLYVHVPFCQSRCHYCDFPSWTSLELIRPYVAALLKELGGLSPWLEAAQVDTLYIGGGTPSLLPPDLVAEIVRATSLGPEAEVTIEANPGTLTLETLNQIRRAGCNRLSIGVQSVHSRELELLGRTHGVQAVSQAVAWAREAGFQNLSLDLMYGIPGQSISSWSETLAFARSLGPEHLSLYALSVEPGTALQRWIKSGRLPRPDPDRTATMYELARNELEAAGYCHYEISNWALPGYQSRHNLAYWRNRPYLGIGASAWGHWPIDDVSWRLRNVRHPKAYIDHIVQQALRQVDDLPISAACIEQDFVPRPWAMAETMFMGLRLVLQGVTRASFQARFGVDPVNHYRGELEKLQAGGWIIWDEEAIRLAGRGLLVSNQILAEFLPD